MDMGLMRVVYVACSSVPSLHHHGVLGYANTSGKFSLSSIIIIILNVIIGVTFTFCRICYLSFQSYITIIIVCNVVCIVIFHRYHLLVVAVVNSRVVVLSEVTVVSSSGALVANVRFAGTSGVRATIIGCQSHVTSSSSSVSFSDVTDCSAVFFHWHFVQQQVVPPQINVLSRI
jgi:hypothetical protein